MFDDLLSAMALIGVTGTLVAAATSLSGAPMGPHSATTAAVEPSLAARAAAPAAAPSSPATMPVYDLPRVVVTGNRLRDGDMLADGRDTAPRPGGPR